MFIAAAGLTQMSFLNSADEIVLVWMQREKHLCGTKCTLIPKLWNGFFFISTNIILGVRMKKN